MTPEAYFAEIKNMGLTPSNVPDVYIDRAKMIQRVPSPYGMTPEQREETIARIKTMQAGDN
jgi:hypothetical protein